MVITHKHCLGGQVKPEGTKRASHALASVSQGQRARPEDGPLRIEHCGLIIDLV